MDTRKLQLYVGVSLLIITILVFLFSFITSFPGKSQVDAQAHALPAVSADLVSPTSSLAKQLNKLTVPSGVPVTVNPKSLGRSNVFQNF